MKHGSLFSGIGGFDLAAQWMGWENVFHCEINPFCQRVLKHYWPDAASYSDIKSTDFTIWRGQLDILTGGFPCQPFSLAGKRKGTGDDRYLWPEMLRAIREIQPRWILGENVFGIVNWDGGMVFEQVCADLENEGYKVQPVILPACSKDAPHKRERTWFVAYADNYGSHEPENRQGNKKGNGSNQAGENTAIQPAGRSNKATALNSYSNRHGLPFGLQYGIGQVNGTNEAHQGRKPTRIHTKTNWSEFPTQPPVCSGDDGLPTELDGVSFSKWRTESIKGFGNAIVPQVAYEIFKVIEQMNHIAA